MSESSTDFCESSQSSEHHRTSKSRIHNVEQTTRRPKQLVVKSSGKNQPRTTEEQQKAFEEYLASMENNSSITLVQSNKNKPLTPEEQQKAFEEYAASLQAQSYSESSSEDSQQATPTKKRTLNRSSSATNVQDLVSTLENTSNKSRRLSTAFTHTIVANKNAPRSLEEQQRALDEYMLRIAKDKEHSVKKEEKEKKSDRFRISSVKHLIALPSSSSKKHVADSLSTSKLPALTEDKMISPLPKSIDLSKFLLYHINITASILDATVGENQADLCNSILSLFIHNRVEQQLITWCLREELNISKEHATLFRDNTSGTLLLSYYCKIKGREYAKQMLAPFYERMLSHQEAIEVDPNRCADATAERNVEVLTAATDDLLDLVLSSLHLLPVQIREIFHQLYMMVHDKYPEYTIHIIGGFYFLRFLAPMIISPLEYGITNSTISAGNRRTLILMTKIIQNISNQLPFVKERYMLPFNDYIEEKIPAIREFLTDITTVPDTEPEVSEVRVERTVSQSLFQANKALRIIIQHVVQYLPKMKHCVARMGDDLSAFSQLEHLLAETEELEPIGYVPPANDDEATSPPSPDGSRIMLDSVPLEINRDAFVTLRDALKQCENELREAKIRLEEEIILRKSMQTIIIQLADQMHSQIDDRVSFKLEMISKKAREAGVDQEFCNEILKYYPNAMDDLPPEPENIFIQRKRQYTSPPSSAKNSAPDLPCYASENSGSIADMLRPMRRELKVENIIVESSEECDYEDEQDIVTTPLPSNLAMKKLPSIPSKLTSSTSISDVIDQRPLPTPPKPARPVSPLPHPPSSPLPLPPKPPSSPILPMPTPNVDLVSEDESNVDNSNDSEQNSNDHGYHGDSDVSNELGNDIDQSVSTNDAEISADGAHEISEEVTDSDFNSNDDHGNEQEIRDIQESNNSNNDDNSNEHSHENNDADNVDNSNTMVVSPSLPPIPEKPPLPIKPTSQRSDSNTNVVDDPSVKQELLHKLEDILANKPEPPSKLNTASVPALPQLPQKPQKPQMPSKIETLSVQNMPRPLPPKPMPVPLPPKPSRPESMIRSDVPHFPVKPSSSFLGVPKPLPKTPSPPKFRPK